MNFSAKKSKKFIEIPRRIWYNSHKIKYHTVRYCK